MADKPSKAAIDLIVESEVTSKAYYEKHYRKPEWPGGASGVTIAVGYDLGFANEAKLRNDWTGKIDDDIDRKSTRLNSSHVSESRMPSSA